MSFERVDRTVGDVVLKLNTKVDEWRKNGKVVVRRN
jgi:predicted  nucleic acid-binding Zn ribbon protein